jgi:hypothetical protein
MAWEWIHISLDSQMVVLMVLVKKQNHMSLCLKSYGPVSQIYGTKCTHSHVPELIVEALFLDLNIFILSANRRLVRICIRIFIIRTHTFEIV